MSVVGLDGVQRAELSAWAGRLRTAARYLAVACEVHAVPAPPELTVWPTTRRTGGWARATDGDQPEDERLHDVIATGRRVLDDLARDAALDPTVQLAGSYFQDAAGRYERASMREHARLRDPRLSVMDGACEVHGGVAELLRAIRDAEELERGMLTVRLVPPALTVAASHLRNDLTDLVEPSDDGALSDPVQLRLVRHLDGTLGILQEHVDCLPESVLAASASAAAALHAWDRATGSFCAAGDRGVAGGMIHAAAAGPAGSSDTDVLARAAGEMGDRAHIAMDIALDGPDRAAGSLSLESLRALARESRLLEDGGLAPLAAAARDSVHRDHAVRLSQVTLDLAADHLDTVDPDQLLLGRAALAAGRAAQEYLTLSDVTAAGTRSRRKVLPSGDWGEGRLEAAAAVWRRLEQELRGEPLSDVAVAEWGAFTADLEWARAARDSLPSTAREHQLRLDAIDRRLADTLGDLVRGDLAAHLATWLEGRRVLAVVEAASERFDAELGLARVPFRAPVRPMGEWLAAGGGDVRAHTDPASRLRRVEPRSNARGRSVARPSLHAADM